jgi:hypothetical protein
MWRSGGLASIIFDLGIRWKWVVEFKPRPLYPGEKLPPYTFYRRLCGPQKWSDLYEEVRNLLLPPGIEPKFFGRRAKSLVVTWTEVFRLCN